MRAKSLAQDTLQYPRLRLEPGLLDPETSVLTTRRGGRGGGGELGNSINNPGNETEIRSMCQQC